MFTKEQLLSIIPENQKKWFVPVEKKKEKVIQNALANYAKGCPREDIVAIYDVTIVSSGKKGFLLATDALYGYDFSDLEGYTNGVNKIPFKGLKDYYCFKDSTIEKEKKSALAKFLYKFLYEDGTTIVIHQGTAYGEEVLPVIDGVLSLIHAKDERETSNLTTSEEVDTTKESLALEEEQEPIRSNVYYSSVQDEVRRKQEELKVQMDALLRQQEVLNQQEKELQREEERHKEEIRLAEEKRREEEASLAEEKRWLEEQLSEKRRKQQGVAYTVRFLGAKGVGKTSLIKALADVAKLHEETVFVESDGRCTIFWKGNTIIFIETSFEQLKEGNLQADQWYLIVGIDEGPIGLYDAIEDIEKVVFSGVFYNKCDLLFAEDEDLIDLIACETQSLLEENNHLEKVQEFRGAAESVGEFGEVLKEFLDKIDPKTAEEEKEEEYISCEWLGKGYAIELDKEPYLVLREQSSYLNGRVKCKIVTCRNLLTSEIRNKRFSIEDKILCANSIILKFSLKRDGQYYFINPQTSKEYILSEEIVERYVSYIHEREELLVVMHQGRPVYMERLGSASQFL